MTLPANPKLYHIVHMDRLASILESGGLYSDSRMRAERCGGTTIGMGDLKALRLRKPVDVIPGTHVGDFVPFYFCSRSVMLYVIYRGNHAALQYRGGQGPILHLEVDLWRALEWAEGNEVQWAVSLGNATAGYAEFKTGRQELRELRWDLIPISDFRDPQVKEAKQSEALFFDFVPWELVERVGAIDPATASQAARIIQDNPIGQSHRRCRNGITDLGRCEMITFEKGDLLNADVEALVNTVNCVGIMGRGIALQFKKMFPRNFSAYAAACAANELEPGKMFVFATGEMTNPRFIINFPTKRHWKGNSKLEDIESGLLALRDEVINRNIKSIAIPPLGSGLGGLPWPAVKQRIVEALDGLEGVDVVVFEPHADSDRMARHERKKAPKLTPYRAALVSIMDRYLRGLMEPEITLLEVHKLAYFLQLSGLAMKLRFVKGHYGPYAENLRHVLGDMEGYYTAGYGDGGDQPFKKISIVPKAVEQSQAILQEDDKTEERFEAIADLIRGFETPLGLELLATTHWAYAEAGKRTVGDITEFYSTWNERKSSFRPRQIELALGQLSSHGWLGHEEQRNH